MVQNPEKPKGELLLARSTGEIASFQNYYSDAYTIATQNANLFYVDSFIAYHAYG